MPTLSGFTRPTDPINAEQLAQNITTTIGKTVTIQITPNDIIVTGPSINGSDNAAIQSAVSSYYYQFMQTGTPVVDNPNMSASRHNAAVSEHAVYSADLSNYLLARGKTANRLYINGVAQNGDAVTGDIVEWIVTKNTSGGTISDYITTEGGTRTSGGTAILSTLFADSIQTNFIDSSGVYAQGVPTVTSNKTVSIPFTKQGFNGVTVLSINVLGSAAMNAIPDGVTVKLRLVGIAA